MMAVSLPPLGASPLAGAEVLARQAAPFAKPVEAAGWAFAHESWTWSAPVEGDGEQFTDAAAAAAAAADDMAGAGAAGGADSTLMAALGDRDDDNYYHLLGLTGVGFNATEKQIKVAYRRKLLELHPDKKAAEAVEEDDADPIFLAVQKAYHVLSDETRKRGYDSQFDFDDSIPNELLDDEKDFFKVYVRVGGEEREREKARKSERDRERRRERADLVGACMLFVVLYGTCCTRARFAIGAHETLN